MIGEIRDEVTASIAMRLAITGHLVLSTLHTNDSIGAITRLTNLDVESFLIANSLKAVISPRRRRYFTMEYFLTKRSKNTKRLGLKTQVFFKHPVNSGVFGRFPGRKVKNSQLIREKSR